MAKKIQRTLKLQIPAGQATPAPPLGPTLGQVGVNIGEFVNQFNEKTREMTGNLVSVVLIIYEDRSFSFEVKGSPASFLIKKALKLEKGSGTPNTNKVGKLTKAQVREIAEEKMADLNADTIEAAERIIAGTARSMGVEIK
ncbi:50S ribosomal protein L11 [Candidatus Wolfebacteria bacterium]|nr:50S ribosomal protein L11 [Candidatus Wolfebacteria bacterium]